MRSGQLKKECLLVLAQDSFRSDWALRVVSLRYHAVEVELYADFEEIPLLWPRLDVTLLGLVLGFGRLRDHVGISVVPNRNFLHRFCHHSNLHLEKKESKPTVRKRFEVLNDYVYTYCLVDLA